MNLDEATPPTSVLPPRKAKRAARVRGGGSEEALRSAMAKRKKVAQTSKPKAVVLGNTPYEDCASGLTVSETRKTVTGIKGFRMVRATHGITSGKWFYECKINEGTGHARIGWCTVDANLDAPVGFDRYGYAYRDLGGGKYHQRVVDAYGEAYGPGDVIGCYVSLPSQTSHDLVHHNVNGSVIAFYKNGKPQGTAFSNIFKGKYYPAISLFGNITVTCNFGPVFEYPPVDPAAMTDSGPSPSPTATEDNVPAGAVGETDTGVANTATGHSPNEASATEHTSEAAPMLPMLKCRPISELIDLTKSSKSSSKKRRAR